MARGRSGQRTKWPGDEVARRRSGQGTKWPGDEVAYGFSLCIWVAHASAVMYLIHPVPLYRVPGTASALMAWARSSSCGECGDVGEITNRPETGATDG